MTQSDLYRLRRIRSEISSYTDRIATLRSDMERTTTVITGLPGCAPQRDKLAGQVARLVELEQEYGMRIVEREELVLRAEDWIATLPEQQARVIRARYVEGMSWRQVARYTHYSIDHCYAINRAVIQKTTVNNSF